MNVFYIDGTRKQGRDFPWRKASDAATDARDQEGHFGMLLGEIDELIDIGLDSVHAALHRGDGIALSLQTNALTHDGAKVHACDSGRTTTVHALQVAAENEDFVFAKTSDVVGRDAVTELIHFAIVAVLCFHNCLIVKGLEFKFEVSVFLEFLVALFVEGEPGAFPSRSVIFSRVRSRAGGLGFRAKQCVDAHAAHFVVVTEKCRLLSLIVHLMEDARLQHFLVEVAAVEMHPEDGFIEALQFGDGEALA